MLRLILGDTIMKLHFAKLNPTENMTILVTDPVPRAQHSAVAEALMAYASVGGEQVGFLEEATLPGARMRLQMMGGEFCGNATMSLAALLAFRENLPSGGEAVYPLEVSGTDGIVPCRIQRSGDVCRGTVCMPLPEEIREVDFPDGVRCPVVFFPGIAHAIVREGVLRSSDAPRCIPRWCEACETDALGIILADDALDRIRPLVYVRSTGSSVWERGCGSGTAALGAYLAHERRGDAALDVAQPGGTIRVEAKWDGERVSRLEISGDVRLAATGEAWI